MHPPARPSNPGPAKVLLVDDDPAMRRILAAWLVQAGYTVVSAEDGQMALEAIGTDPPDFLITDWEMPRMNGLELCRRVRQLQLPHYVYIVFLTVRSAPDEIIEGLELGADDFLAKPVYEGELLARMRAGRRVLDLEHQLSRAACTDALTGLMTQEAFYHALEKEWQRAERNDLPLSLVMLDLDGFQGVNDACGRRGGDAVLREVAGVLTRTCRGSDSICRCGGEEFGAMLPEATLAQATQWARRMRARLATVTLPATEKPLHLTAGIGIAGRQEDVPHCEALVEQAIEALRAAKQAGRGQIVGFPSLRC